MLDAITFEKRGIPAASVGEEHLMKTVGVAMKKVHGMPDYPLAIIPEGRSLDSLENENDLRAIAKLAAPQVEAILVQK